jgi:hypothetical protein
MKSSQSSSISPYQAQVLVLLDWWVESKRDRILDMLKDADPDGVNGTTIEAVGLCLMRLWDWETEFFQDVQNNDLALLIWTRYSPWWLSTGHMDNRHLDWEVAGRIGAIAKGQGWIEKHRKALERAGRRLRAVKKIQEA